MSRFDYADPGTDPAYCDGLSAEPEPVFECVWCNSQVMEGDDDTHYPYCSDHCAINAENTNPKAPAA